ncbi:MAG: hypothetical protein ACREM1_22125 [Longimicrobiales bacterium]
MGNRGSARLARSAAVLGLVVSAAPAAAQDWRTVSSARQAAGEERLNVHVEYGAGRLSIAPGEGDLLYHANIYYDADVFEPITSYADGRLRLGVEGGNRVRGGHLESGRLELRLGPSVPLDLDLRFGASEADLELGGLPVRGAAIKTGASKTELRVSQPNPEVCESISIEVGAATFQAMHLGNLNAEQMSLKGGVGEVTLDFTGEWRTDLTADIDMGLGALNLRVPNGLGVSIRRSGFLAGFDSQGLIKRGDVYFSENWEEAQHRLTVNLDATLGSIRVTWVENPSAN